MARPAGAGVAALLAIRTVIAEAAAQKACLWRIRELASIRSGLLFGAACMVALAAVAPHAQAAETYICQSGNLMGFNESVDRFVVTARTASTSPAAPGECIRRGGDPLPEGGGVQIQIPKQAGQAAELARAAAEGGTFTFQADVQLETPGAILLILRSVDDVRIAENAGAGAVADGDDDLAGDDGETSGAATSAECPAGVATVSTSSVGEDVLNVRAKPSREADIVAQVPDGSQVSVTGACFTGGAGFAKGQTLKPKGDGGKAKPQNNAQGTSGGWCRIEEPAQGCVMARFLAFGEAPKMGGAGFAKQKASQAASFAGNWSANADDVAYSMSMTQKGGSVSGTYRGADGSQGSFKGKLKGNVLRFAWKQADGISGSGKFVLAADGGSFDGSYSFGSNPDEAEGSWSGTRD